MRRAKSNMVKNRKKTMRGLGEQAFESNRREKSIEKSCVTIALRFGLFFEKRTGPSGTFDRLLFGRPIAPVAVQVELKREVGGRLSPAQFIEKKRLDDMGYPNAVIDNVQDFENLCLKMVNRYGR